MLFIILLWLELQLILADDPTLIRNTSICVKRNFFNYDSPIATDTGNFLEFVNRSYVYVDKSLFIKEFLEVKRPLVRITYPSKWGKSLCLNMLKTFFELDIEALNNNSIDYPVLPKRPSYKYFTEGKIVLAGSNLTQELKTPPLISTQEEIITKYLGKYPVIYLDLSTCRGKNIDNLFLQVKQAFNRTYHDHLYLKKALKAGSNNAKTLNLLLSVMDNNETGITGSLRFLSRMLCKFNDKKAFIFIDGYDTIINQVYFAIGSEFNKHDRNRVASFLIKLLQDSFIDNNFLEKGVITGTLEVLQHRCFSSTKYVKRYNLLNPSEFFALNKYEVQQIFQELEFDLPPDAYEKAIQWYAGYKMNKKEELLLNPWSVAKFLKSKNLASSWRQSQLKESLFKTMIKNDHVTSTLESLAQGAYKRISITDLDFNEQELSYLSEIINGSVLFRVFDDSSYTLLISYLYASGFLTLNGNTENVKSKIQVDLKIPNSETSKAVIGYIGEFVDAMKSTTTTTVRTVEPFYDDFVRPVILEKEVIRISHKPREYNLI